VNFSIPKPTSILELLRPRRRSLLIALAAGVGVLTGYGLTRAGFPIWGGTLAFLGVMAIPVSLKWRDDLERFGVAAAGLSVLLALQGFHTVEHVVQLAQFYLFNRPGIEAQGLISSLNVEWVHFVWNWLAWGGVVYLVRSGMKGLWGYPLLVWVTLHSAEHTFMLLHYLHVNAELGLLGQPMFQAAQVLPGFLGRDGWLANNVLFCRSIPGLATLPRVAIHFYWNVGEMTFLLLAARESLPRLARSSLHTVSIISKGQS
jgi:hypothetical protein